MPVRAFVRPFVSNALFSESALLIFLKLCNMLEFCKRKKVTVSDFWRKFSFLTFWPFLVQKWPNLVKNCHFWLFLQNATFNSPDFWYRNYNFGLLLEKSNGYAGKILVFDFWPFLTYFQGVTCFF